MIELHITPEQHFENVKYTESELLIFKYDTEEKRLLFCFDDLSEKIPEWVSSKKKVNYLFRYKILYFQGISNFQRSELNTKKYPHSPNDFYIAREALPIPILDINVQQQSVGYKVYLCLNRGFGIVDFYCQDIKVYELPFYYKNRRGEKNYYYVDMETKKDFDEEGFLMNLYEGKACTNFK